MDAYSENGSKGNNHELQPVHRIDLFSEVDETGRFFKHEIESDNGVTLALLREAFTATRGTGVLNRNNSEHVMILELGKGV
jgi:hypothetical protein